MKKSVTLAMKAIVAAAFTTTMVLPAVAETAQPTPSAPMDSVPEKVAPGAKPTEPPKNLSQELDQSNGVIHPKEVDPGIEKPAPKTHTDDVIQPPGSMGGSASPPAEVIPSQIQPSAWFSPPAIRRAHGRAMPNGKLSPR